MWSVATAPWERTVCDQTARRPEVASSYCEQLDQRHERGSSSAVTRSAGISGSLVAAVVLLAAGGTAATALTHDPEPAADPVARTMAAAGPAAGSQPVAIRPVSTQQATSTAVAPPAPLDALTTAIEDLVAQRGRSAPTEPTPPPPRLASAAPTYGTVTSGYGSRWNSTHYGLDIANVIGTPVVSTSDGEIIESGPADGFGLWIRVLQDDGTIGVYGHINETLVSAGQRVQAGEQIATVGNRGYSTGPHLHYEVWQSDGLKLDPAQWLRNRGVDLG
ncbi:M23 family metallopeptidase [Williamsia sp. 1135]|uniref:M23 family metallopeptidase n=1 Tax=Williamsia sp. 1135 TaxID=1889262 RepID=UPI001F0A99C4|nr:M23 family metallopeptidase [Williamsia sp. 1135]